MDHFDTTGTPVRIDGPIYRYTNYYYDNRNRIIQTVTNTLVPVSPLYRVTVNYYYNAAGNNWKTEYIHKEVSLPDSLCEPHCPPIDTATLYYKFDNKTDFHNLHPVWQFVDKNYSRNNAYQVLSYDSCGLPTAFLPAPPSNYTYMLGIPMSKVAIRYQYLP
jgi:hypothetical protein